MNAPCLLWCTALLLSASRATAQIYVGCYKDNGNVSESVASANVGDVNSGPDSFKACLNECRFRFHRTYAGIKDNCTCYDSVALGEPMEGCVPCPRRPDAICSAKDLIAIYTVCPLGSHRGDTEADPLKPCQGRCFCQDNAVCQYSTGTCPRGCRAGWTGAACNKREEYVLTTKPTDQFSSDIKTFSPSSRTWESYLEGAPSEAYTTFSVIVDTNPSAGIPHSVPPEKPTESNGIGIGVAVGVSIAVFCIAAIVIAAIFISHRKGRKRPRRGNSCYTSVSSDCKLTSLSDRQTICNGDFEEETHLQPTPADQVNRTAQVARIPLISATDSHPSSPRPSVTSDSSSPDVEASSPELLVPRDRLDDTVSVASTLFSLDDSKISREDLENTKGANLSNFTRVTLQDLASYVKNLLHDSDALIAEYERIPLETAPSHTASKAEFNSKNRFRNIAPYDHNRVVLDTRGGELNGHYINASFIQCYAGRDIVIATQGPTKSTVDDFWRLVWQQNVATIVMLTKLVEDGKIKCEEYWPSNGHAVYGDVAVTMQSSQTWPDFTQRTFMVKAKCEAVGKVVIQHQFTSWPDHGAPRHAAALLRFRRKLLSSMSRDHQHLYHCSAGVGRTGTFLALEWLLQQAEAENAVDIYSCVHTLRENRMKMVQTVDQYAFLHTALLEALTIGDTPLPLTQFTELYTTRRNRLSITGLPMISSQFQVLESMAPSFHPQETTVASLPANVSKNRSHILPPNEHRVILKSDPDYVNAVFVSSYRSRRGYIVTQWPLVDTLSDFWDMIYQREVSVVICLENMESQPGHPKLIPGNKSDVANVQLTNRLGNSILESSDVTINPSYYANVEQCMTYQEGEERQLRVITLKQAPSESLLSPVQIMAVIEAIKNTPAEPEAPLVVVDRDGNGLCGLFIATRSLLEMAEMEEEVDIFYVVQQMKTSRPELVATETDYRHIHELVGHCLSSATR